MRSHQFFKNTPIMLLQRISIVIIVSFIATSCSEYAPPVPTKLPDATITGANTFGCYIETDLYIPEYRTITFEMPGPLIVEFPFDTKHFFDVNTSRIVNKKDPFQDAAVAFSIANVKDTGDFKVINGLVEFEGRYYHTDSINNGKITITKIDSLQKIISGTFYFKAKDRYSDKTVNVTSGRFDFNKNTLP